MTNPAQSSKVKPSRLPWRAIGTLAELLEHGASKHKDDKPWKHAGFLAEYREKLSRHYLSYIQGQNIDKDSGYLEVLCIAANALFLAEWYADNGAE